MLRRPVTGEVARRDVPKGRDKRTFRNTANSTHYLNRSRRNIMRGGIRL